MSEGIPVGLDELRSYLHAKQMREWDELHARLRALTAKTREDNARTDRQRIRFMADTLSGQVRRTLQ